MPCLLLVHGAKLAVLTFEMRLALPPLLPEQTNRGPIHGNGVCIDDLQATRAQIRRANCPEVLLALPVSKRKGRAVDHDKAKFCALASKLGSSGHGLLNRVWRHPIIAEEVVGSLSSRAAPTNLEHLAAGPLRGILC